MFETSSPVEIVGESPNGDMTKDRLEIPEAEEKRRPSKDSNASKEHRNKRATGLFDFINVDAIKEKARSEKKLSKEYDVKDLYYETGFIQKIARSAIFENFTLGVIVVNAIWIGVDTDGNRENNPARNDYFDCNPWCAWYFMVADAMFFIYFAIEVMIRFLAFKKKFSCLFDRWFVFDSTLVTLYAFDPFVLAVISKAQGGASLNLPTSVLRLFRLARLSRLVRMLRSLPELMILIKGMVTSLRPAFSAMVLLILITYVFAIAMVNLFPPDHPFRAEKLPASDVGFFYSVPDSMHSLIVFATFLDDLSQFVYPIKDEHILYLVPIFIYIALSNMVVFNMLIGVMCAVITGVAMEEKESMMIDKVHEQFGAIAQQLDTNFDNLISWEEFTKIVEYPDAIQALESMNVDPEVLIEIAEDFFVDDGEPVCVTFDEFMNLLLDMRGGEQAKVSDVMRVSKSFSKKFHRVQKRVQNLEHRATDLIEKLNAYFRSLPAPGA